MTRTVEDYINSVLDRLPRAWPGRSRIEADLRLHFTELLEETNSPEAALERMGPPERVAAELLTQIPLSPASYSRRFFGFVLDMAFILIPLLPMFVLAIRWQEVYPDGGSPYAPLVVIASLLLGALALAYFPVLEAIYGQTPGKRIVGTYVVREDGSRVGWGAAIVRRIPLFMNFFPLDALFVYFTEHRQRAFDKVAGTLVIRCH